MNKTIKLLSGKLILANLDARALLLGGLVLILANMVLPWGAGFWTAAGMTLILLLFVPSQLKRIFAPIWGFGWMFLITLLIQGFNTPGHLIWEMPGIHWVLSREGLLHGVLLSGHLILAILVAGVLGVSLSPLRALHAVEELARPLSKVGISLSGYLLSFALAFRFVPTLYEEAVTLKKSLLARGWSSGSTVPGKIRAWIPLVAPLLSSGLRRADDLARTMVARGYNPSIQRTSLYPSRWGWGETLVIGITLSPYVVSVIGAL